ncbi:unnamed protein product [Orchesella dallaii]|uniref:Uncharacterized protein n=1 Tax=Orchesella dallaii TaxID=48710 RepID=A0ABP1R6I6_9HEXA
MLLARLPNRSYGTGRPIQFPQVKRQQHQQQAALNFFRNPNQLNNHQLYYSNSGSQQGAQGSKNLLHPSITTRFKRWATIRSSSASISAKREYHLHLFLRDPHHVLFKPETLRNTHGCSNWKVASGNLIWCFKPFQK